MTTMNISLPDSLKAFVEAQMTAEGYASASEYFRTLLREEQRRLAKMQLEEMLMEGMKGPRVKMTRKEWKSIEKEALKRLAGEDIRP